MLRPLIAIFVLALGVATAQQYPIIALSASGSQRYSSSEVLAATGLAIDISKPVSLQQVRSAAQKLVNSGVFADVGYKHAAATGGMSVQFTVKDKPADQFIPAVFDNVVWLSDDALIAELRQRVPLFHGDVPLEGQLTDDIARAAEAALAAHHVAAHVASEQSCQAEQEHCLRRFAIDNLQIVTTQLDVAGAPSAIAADVQQRASDKLLGQPFRRTASLPEFVRLIRAACLRRGLLKPQITAPDAQVLGQSGDRVSVALRAQVTPGPAYKYEGHAWSGNAAVPAATLDKLVHLYLHLPVDGAKLEDDLEQVRWQYAMRGYMHARVTYQPTFDDAKGAVQYAFKVDEGPLYKMGIFEVSGLPDKVAVEITSLWKLRQGDPFDRVYIQRFFAEPRIQQLFSGQKFVVEQSEGDEPTTLDVSVVLCLPSGCKPSPGALYVSHVED